MARLYAAAAEARNVPSQIPCRWIAIASPLQFWVQATAASTVLRSVRRDALSGARAEAIDYEQSAVLANDAASALHGCLRCIPSDCAQTLTPHSS